MFFIIKAYSEAIKVYPTTHILRHPTEVLTEAFLRVTSQWSNIKALAVLGSLLNVRC